VTLTMEERHAIREAWDSHGGMLIRRLLAEQISEPKEVLWDLMSRKPETLTGKVALKHAIRSKALTDFQESIEDELKPLNPREGQRL